MKVEWSPVFLFFTLPEPGSRVPDFKSVTLFLLPFFYRTGAVDRTSFAPSAKNFLEESVVFTLSALLVLLGSH